MTELAHRRTHADGTVREPATLAVLDGLKQEQRLAHGADEAPAPPARRRLRRPSRRTWLDLLVLLPLLAVSGALARVNMFSSPARIDDEGTYVAQAWAVLNLGELTHYTYWYDHPPLGWLQIAAWAGLTDAFDRAPTAVGAGRELTLVAMLVSAALLWVVARRLDLPRWGAALAVVLFAVSPLAVEFHRYVYLDNIATPWILGAFALALSRRRSLIAFTAAAAFFAVAVLTKETSLLLLPVLAWLVWTRATGGTRRYVVAVGSAVMAVGALAYLAFALIKGEVLPGPDRTSVLGGVMFQLQGREASGSIFTPGTLGNTTVSLWLDLDPVLPALALVATPLALLVRRLRPFAVGMLVLAAMLVRPGYLPVPFVIAMLPLAALLVAGVAVAGTRLRPSALAGTADRVQGTGGARRPLAALVRRPVALLVVAGLAAAGVGAAATWTAPLRSSLLGPLDTPLVAATRYVSEQAAPGQRVLTDDSIWVDLVSSGLRRDDVVWYYKPDTDPAVPSGVENYTWAVSTDSMRADLGSAPTVTDALQDGLTVAVFGTGDQRVEILRLPGADGALDPETEAAARAVRTRAGQALAANPRVTSDDDGLGALADGRVDARLMTLLAVGSARKGLQVGLPEVVGEDAAGQLRRTLVVTAVDGEPLALDGGSVDSVVALLRSQPDYLAPDDVLVRTVPGGGAEVRATWDLRPLPATT